MNRAYLGLGEANRILAAERIVRKMGEKNKYTDGSGNVNWAAWAQADPQGAEILADAMEAAKDEGLLEDG